MADNKKTKAELIRDEIAKRKAKGDDPIRPRDIIAALENRGIKVAAPQVSVALRDFGKKSGEKPAQTSKAAKTAATPKTAEKAPKRATAKLSAGSTTSAPAANEPSYEALEAAAAFVKTHGGLEQAKSLLNAYARLFN